MGSPRKIAAVGNFSSQLSSEDVAQRRLAAERLAQDEEAARMSAPQLVKACGDVDHEVREWSVSALESLGVPPCDNLKELSLLLSDDNGDVVFWAATLIGRLGTAAAPATAALTEVLNASSHLPARERAVWALGKIGSAASMAIPSLEQAAKSPHVRLARLANELLISSGQGLTRSR